MFQKILVIKELFGDSRSLFKLNKYTQYNY
jgi:hypothetical protein